MEDFMKRSTFAFALLAVALTAACSDDDDNAGPASESRVRVVHASPDAPAVDVLVDGTRVLSDVPYTTASGYLTVDAGSRNLKVNAAGTSTSVIDANVTLADGADYTVIAGGLLADIAPIVATDDNAAPASGNVKLRVVHGAPSAPAVDVYVTAPGADLSTTAATLSNVAFGAVSGYLEVPAGTYQVRITPTGSKTVAIDAGSVTLSSGQVRTAIALDAEGGGAPFSVLLLEDVN
jgi:hypothetical protein